MASAEIHETLNVDKDKLYQVITAYERYPEFVEGCQTAKVDSKTGSVAKVTYGLNLVKDISYTLEHQEDAAAGKVTWKLLSSDFLKVNTGGWELKSLGAGKTDVKYQLEVEFKIPVPGFILNRLIKSSLPTMLKNFEKQAKK